MDSKKSIKNITSSKKFRYGSAAIAFTVIFSAFIILLNAVFSFIADRNGGFYADLTTNRIYDLSEETMDVLSNLEQKVEIIFCMTEDKVDDVDTLLYVKRLAEKYASACGNVTISFRDSQKDPIYFNQFKKTSADTISNHSVIVNCAETKRYVVYSERNFFKFSSGTGSVFAYDGENKLTSAIMQTAIAETQRAAFITGHGEDKRNAMETLLREQGYEVSDIEISAVTEEELSRYDLLIICNPKYDYTGISEGKEGRVNEIGMLSSYLTRSYGNLMVFIGPDTPSLPELSSFLADDWGVSYKPGSVIYESSAAALDPYGLYFIGTASDPSTSGGRIHSAITSSGVQATVFANASPLDITFSEKGEREVSAVYVTSGGASIYRDGKLDENASAPVMTLSTYTKIYDGVERRANVLVCGSVEYLNYVSVQSYANADVLKSAFSAMGNKSVVTGIGYKVLDDTAITVSQDDFKKYMVLLSTVVPVIIAAVGIFVYMKRKKA